MDETTQNSIDDNEIDAFQPSIDRLSENLIRVYSLVKIYNDLYGKGKGRRHVHKTDLLRAAVVFLHASLEDFLRSLATKYLPQTGEDTLTLIPLAGLNSAGRPEKFSLGTLAKHRGKTIDALIQESVAQYLERSNYNNTQEIASLLSSIGIDVSKVSQTFSELDRMMRRRHQIVHRADRVERKGRGRQYAQSINPAEVLTWIKTTQVFMGKVLAQMVLTVHPRSRD